MDLSKLEQVSKILQENKQDVACIVSPQNILYLTGFYCEPYERLLLLFVFPNQKPIIVCPELEVERVRQVGWNFQIISYKDSENPWDLIEKEIYSTEIQNIFLDEEEFTISKYKKMKKIFSKSIFNGIDSEIDQLKKIKSKQEVEYLKEAAKQADFAIKSGIEALREGITEIEVQSYIDYNLKKNQMELGFAPLVLFGDKPAEPHGVTGNNKLKKGDFVLFDLGAKYKNYFSDMTRTFVFGGYNKKQKEIYDIVLKAQSKAIEICKPGVKLKDIDAIARNYIDEQGYGEYFTHRIGHGLGISVHEAPSIHGTNEDVLEKGMVFTIEPGIYIPQWGGVRIEDDVLITETGVEILTKYPKHFQNIT